MPSPCKVEFYKDGVLLHEAFEVARHYGAYFINDEQYRVLGFLIEDKGLSSQIVLYKLGEKTGNRLN